MTLSFAGRRLGGDIESDGLLRASKDAGAMTKFHCIGFQDIDTGEEWYFGPPVPLGHVKWDPIVGNPAGTVEEGVMLAQEAELLVFHNGVNFDYRAMEKFFPQWKRPKKAWDSYIAAKLIWPPDALEAPDFARWKKGQMPPGLIKSHSLKAWGYRLGELKDEYVGDFDKYPEDGNPETAKRRYAERWSEWNPYMASYMMQDNRPMVKLWKLIEKRAGWTDPEKADLVWPEFVFEYEHEAAGIIAEQEDFGVRFDLDKAHDLERELRNQRARLNAALEETFGSWWQAGEVVTPKRAYAEKLTQYPDVTIRKFSEKTGKELKPYVGPPLNHFDPEGPYTPIERVTFKASSRDHLGQRLQDVYGWHPKKFGKTGKPTVDESVLEEIPEAVLPPDIRKLILDYFVVNKTLGMLASGSKAWLNLVTEEGRIHGRVDSCGAVTRRGTHKDPNLGQCPAVRKAKVVHDDGRKEEVILRGLEGRYGYESRELFTADDGWEQTGVDASALELIDLGHYLVPYDDGAFRDRVCDPNRDPHTEHAEITGLTRADTKTATYLYVYGGSAYKLSLDIGVDDEEVPELLSYRGLPMLLKSLERRFDADFVAKLDDRQKARIVKARKIILAFEGGITGIKELKEAVTAAAEKGWLKGMDGSKLYVRKSHAALNTLLQSAGAMTCKLWMVLTHRKLRARGLIHGRDFKQVLWIHDELQFTHPPGRATVIIECAYEAIREAGEMLGLRGAYRGDAKTGKDWAECH